MQDKRVKLFTRLEPQHGCAFATMAIDGIDPGKLSGFLWEKHKIFVTHVEYPETTKAISGIRVSPNTYTTLDEIDMFCQAVEGVLANGFPASWAGDRPAIP